LIELPAPDESLAARLPLPLAQLYRRAHNAKTAIERHLTAFHLWEAPSNSLARQANLTAAAGQVTKKETVSARWRLRPR
jgi:hypothetical protein